MTVSLTIDLRGAELQHLFSFRRNEYKKGEAVMKRIIGSLCIKNEIEIRADSSADTLNEWAVCLNSPWSNGSVSYVVSRECGTWKASYCVNAMNGISAEIYGYADSPERAIMVCREFFAEIQIKYNPENRKF